MHAQWFLIIKKLEFSTTLELWNEDMFSWITKESYARFRCETTSVTIICRLGPNGSTESRK